MYTYVDTYHDTVILVLHHSWWCRQILKRTNTQSTIHCCPHPPPPLSCLLLRGPLPSSDTRPLCTSRPADGTVRWLLKLYLPRSSWDCSVIHKEVLRTPVILLVIVHLRTLTVTNETHMYVLFATLTGVFLCDHKRSFTAREWPKYILHNQGMTDLGNCVTYRQMFTDTKIFYPHRIHSS